MKEKTSPGFFTSLFLVLIIFSLAPASILTIIGNNLGRSTALSLSRYELLENAKILSSLVLREKKQGGNILALLEGITTTSSLRITLINRGGQVLFDSESDPLLMENHGARPEIRSAFETGEGYNLRKSRTTNIQTNYTALRIDDAALELGPWVLRTALELPEVEKQFATQSSFVILALLFVALIASLAAYLYSKNIIRPLNILEHTAKLWAQGNFASHLRVHFPRELVSLSQSMDIMAEKLKTRMEEIDGARQSLSTIIEAMGEALIVCDAHGHVELTNTAARTLFADASAKGKFILSLTHSTELASLEFRCRQGGVESSRFVLYYPRTMHVQVHGAPLPDNRGSVLLLSDVSRTVQLETVRKDFVANVSHELKTPIQSIKGFVEALQEGAEQGSKEERFLGIIQRNTLRMEALISDLLLLAGLEHQQEHGTLESHRILVKDLVELAIESLTPLPGQNPNLFELSGDTSLAVMVQPVLVEQAILNLLDNARRYGGADKPVRVSWQLDSDWLALHVADEGPGIPLHEQDRIFERFYRLEKSRNRDSGGTGLGLAIVRHVAKLHGGAVTLSGGPGRGMIFTLRLPLAKD